MRRNSLLLPFYDYSSAGFYFLTICVQNREPFLGKILNKKMFLSDAGKIVHDLWHKIPLFSPNMTLDEFIVMPDHIHGILVTNGTNAEINTRTINTVMGSYKSVCTKQINAMQDRFYFKWQRGFYDHIIRNECSLNQIREYIRLNPEKWEEENISD
ncbi:MAG TPA: transposase, partial [Gammaproteobacteria bacterium]|nr:transposase [Gammaproteobacteria bacterium]